MQIPSYYYAYKGQVLDWLPMDTEERYNNNLLNNKKELEKHGWLENYKFKYSINSYGFRSEEFTDEPSVMYLGCSHTVGIGLPVEDTWPRLTSKRINLKCMNLGVGGAALDTMFRLSTYWVERLKPKIVVLYAPMKLRLEIAVNQKDPYNYKFLIPQSIKKFPEYKPFLEKWFAAEENYELNHLKNSLAIEYICLKNNIKFVNLTEYKMQWKKDLARDLEHAGKVQNQLLSDYAVEKINEALK